MIYLLIICFIAIGFLGYKLSTRQQLDNEALEQYNEQLNSLKNAVQLEQNKFDAVESKLLDVTIRCNTERNNLETARERLGDCERQLKQAQASYNDLIGRKTREIDSIMEEQRQRRQNELDQTFEEKKARYDLMLQDTQQQCEAQEQAMQRAIEESYADAQVQIQKYKDAVEQERMRFDSIRQPLMQYEMDKQARLYYTIQLPEEYQPDTYYLLTAVAEKVQHPDVISKLVWAEYVKPYLDDTFRRADIRPESGIYKLTNINTGKAYIGKSTDVKKRIADHFKSSVGIKSIADQAVHHEILKTGFWNWTIEVITYCDKDKLSELEKYYIDFFKTQEHGFNKNAGGGG